MENTSSSQTNLPGWAADSLSKEHFESLFEFEKHAILITDSAGYLITCNCGAEQIYGYTRFEIMGKNLYELYFEEDIRKGLPWINVKIAREKGKCGYKGWRYKKDETIFYADTILIALFNPDKSLRGFAEVTRDITSQKKIEKDKT